MGTVGLTALLLALAAAGVHAAWNIMLSGERDTYAATAVAVAAGALAFAPVAVVTWDLDAAVIPFAVASVALESVYLALLAAGYSRADMGFVYPIARGAAPVLVLAAGVVALGAGISTAAAVAVLVVAAGIVLINGPHAPAHWADLALALGVAACIASYTLVDKSALDHGSPLPYLEVVFACTAVVCLAVVLVQRGAPALRVALTWRNAVAGLGFFGSYALALAALTLAPAATVAAVRESSVVIAVGVLAIIGRETVDGWRIGGAVAIAAGVAWIALA